MNRIPRLPTRRPLQSRSNHSARTAEGTNTAPENLHRYPNASQKSQATKERENSEAAVDGQEASPFPIAAADDKHQAANTEIFIAGLQAVATHKTTFDDPMPLITRGQGGEEQFNAWVERNHDRLKHLAKSMEDVRPRKKRALSLEGPGSNTYGMHTQSTTAGRADAAKRQSVKKCSDQRMGVGAWFSRGTEGSRQRNLKTFGGHRRRGDEQDTLYAIIWRCGTLGQAVAPHIG
ncbi:MAG: hypothetical protein Q9208_003357 [Pyrenodesmia sp. 3 TL-2023]